MNPKTYTIPALRCNQFSKVGNEFDICTFDSFDLQGDALKVPHRHEYYMLFFATAGAGRQIIDFQSHPTQAGQITLMYPGQLHAWEQSDRLKGYLVFFTEGFFSMRYNNNNLLDFPFFQYQPEGPFVDTGRQQGHFEQLFQMMLEEYEAQGLDSIRALRSYLNIVLIECKRLYQATGAVTQKDAAQQILRDFERLVQENYHRYHLVRDYAQQMLLTPNYLNAVCKRLRGKSAGVLIRERIMLEARRLLVHDSGTVAEVGQELSFQDNAYFCRFFKKYEGVSPEQFRRKYRKKY
ncbi:MAG: helix-turn-helix domain-containing protein [Phaeodactylibacter sp.]|nr:helix-turn-helix domain-containing protein [Phaeodactylibacter sp.]